MTAHDAPLQFTASSAHSFHHAVRQAMDRAHQAGRPIRWFELRDAERRLDDGRVAGWDVTLTVGFAARADN